VHAGFWCGNLGERDLLEDRGVDGRIILKWIFKKQDGRGGLDSSGRGQGQWRGVVNTVMNLRVP